MAIVPDRPRPHLRVIVVLLFVNLGVSAVFGVLTLLFRTEIVDFQLAGGSDQTRDDLELSLWIRALLLIVVAVAYIWIARRLLAGRRAAYLRVRAISMIGLVAVGYLLLSGAYPVWLRSIEVVQVLLLAALVVATNLRVVRQAFPRSTTPDPRPTNRRAALLLVVLAPVVAEVMLGNVSLALAWTVLIYVPIYGAGALLVRELVRRVGGGLGSLLLMGLAYGLLEEGLALQGLTSPTLYGASHWAPPLFGVNVAYAELNLPYHAVFSVLIPIMLVELVFPQHGRLPYLRRPGVIITGVVTLLGAALMRLAVPPTIDPDYVIPLPAAITIVVLIAAATLLALRILPRRSPWRPAPLTPPSRTVVGTVCGLAALAYIGLTFPFDGAKQPAFTHGLWVLLPMAAAAVIALTGGMLALRWSAAPEWSDRYRLVALGGALIGHTVFAVAARATTWPDRIAMVVVLAITAVLLVRLDRRQAAGVPVSPGRSAVPAPPSPHRSPRR
ncbi:hypothetical protein [Pseudonocardia sp. GCM10023141]|uniref:hypothetical protein n=1 Tax=Pseudonocardia sp. GCM10023141 TaxID=3252653 RepID=UPI00360BF098